MTIEWVRLKGTAKAYRYFVFLNSSVRGPFFPGYMPPDWQWTQAYTSRLSHSVKAGAALQLTAPHAAGARCTRLQNLLQLGASKAKASGRWLHMQVCTAHLSILVHLAARACRPASLA